MKFLLSFAFSLLPFAAFAQSVTITTPAPDTPVVGVWAIEAATTATAVDRVDFHVDGVLAGVARKAPYRIAYDFGSRLEPRVLKATVWTDGYRKSVSTTIRTGAFTAADTITVDAVEVPLHVRSSRPITAADVRVVENGVEQKVRELKPGRGPAHFAFVVDRSLSMGGGKLEAALAAIDAVMPMLRDGDSASLILFNHNVAKGRTIAGSGSARSLLQGITPSGGTSLRDAVASIPNAQRTYAFVITDGGDRNSLLSDEAALRKISTTRTTIFSLVLGSPARFLERAATNTGGSLVRASASTLARDLQRLVTDINSRYTLAYQSSAQKNGWRTIAVTSKRRGVEIAGSRKGYWAE